MPTKTPSTSSQRRRTARKSTLKSTAPAAAPRAKKSKKAAGPSARARTSSKGAKKAGKAKSKPAQAVAIVREELAQLGKRWKSILPRLKKTDRTTTSEATTAEERSDS